MKGNKKYIPLNNPEYAMYVDIEPNSYTDDDVCFIIGIESAHPTWHYNRKIEFKAEDSFAIFKSQFKEFVENIENQLNHMYINFKIYDYQGDTDSEINFETQGNAIKISGRIGATFAECQPVMAFEFFTDIKAIKTLNEYFKEVLI